MDAFIQSFFGGFSDIALVALPGGQGLASQQAWPVFDPVLATDDTVTLAVPVKGKLRASLKL